MIELSVKISDYLRELFGEEYENKYSDLDYLSEHLADEDSDYSDD